MARRGGGPLRVHVCIDQELADVRTSGLVRVWTCFAEEAAHDPDLDLTIHAVGPVARTRPFASNVRIIEHPLGVASTVGLERLGLSMPAHTGLWPFHRELAQALLNADVIHTTYTLFTFAQTALWVSKRNGIPLVSSLQTQVPQHAEIYAHDVAKRMFDQTPLSGLMVQRHGFSRFVRRALDAQARWYFAQCDRVLISSEPDAASLPPDFPRERVVQLGRGIDRSFFHPSGRSRAFLRARFAVPHGVPVLLYVGKLMPEKNVLMLAHALRQLRQRGRDFRLLVCGRGSQQEDVKRLLGDRVILAGVQSHDDLRRIYASADLLTFPSATETFGQVVMEAMCSGLAPLVSATGGACQHVRPDGEVGLVVAEDQPEEWAYALRVVLEDRARIRRMGFAARRRAETVYFSWRELLEQVVKPVWTAVSEERQPRLTPSSLSEALRARASRRWSRALPHTVGRAI